MGFRSRFRLAQIMVVTMALGVSVSVMWAASAYHPGESMILLGYGLPVIVVWALAGFLLYLPRKVRETARLARALGLSDPRTQAFLDWAERAHLTDQAKPRSTGRRQS